VGLKWRLFNNGASGGMKRPVCGVPRIPGTGAGNAGSYAKNVGRVVLKRYSSSNIPPQLTYLLASSLPLTLEVHSLKRPKRVAVSQFLKRFLLQLISLDRLPRLNSILLIGYEPGVFFRFD
jgi:hypothetical protein